MNTQDQGRKGSLTVGLVQINNSFSGQNYLPYSVGCLQSHVMAHAADPQRYRFLMPIYRRTPIRDIVNALVSADVIGLSLYVWNARITLEVARRLKQRNPNVVIVCGGPHVPDRADDFLRQNPFIDVCIHGEGEGSFLQLLEALPARDWSQISSTSFIDAAGAYQQMDRGKRMRDPDATPSPYLSGVFAPLMAANPQENWIGLWETNRGCPFQCTFCDWGSATATKVNQFGLDRLYKEIGWFADNKIEYVFCCDANFGILPRDVDLATHVAEVKRTTGYPHALSVQNTKNATERAYATQKTLSDAGLNKGVALSMQSLDGTTLKNIKRDNISLDTYFELQRRFTRDGVETYSDLILGLPGETYESYADGVSRLIEAGQHNRIQFNNLTILPNAEIGGAEYLKKFSIEVVETEIVNFHGMREQMDDDVAETQQLVVSTYSMPRAAWRKTRVFSWMVSLLYFDKIFQMPLTVAKAISSLSYRELVEAVIAADPKRYPRLASIVAFFEKCALDMQAGAPEYLYSREWLGIYWPMDEYIFIQMTEDGKMDAFYAEAGKALCEAVKASDPDAPLDAIMGAVELNRQLIHRPFAKDSVDVALDYDILGFCRGVFEGNSQPLIRRPTSVRIDRSVNSYSDFQAWCREIVWWGNKKGAYLYTGRAIAKELAGHF